MSYASGFRLEPGPDQMLGDRRSDERSNLKNCISKTLAALAAMPQPVFSAEEIGKVQTDITNEMSAVWNEYNRL